jgi:predicted acyl esterase
MAPLKYGSIPLIRHPTNPVSPSSHYNPSPTPPSGLLQKSSILFDGHIPLPSDILFEYDLPVTLRDDVAIYCDIYRPPNTALGTVPAILVAGPFGKNGGPNKYHFHKTPWRMGCPRAATSGLEKFEGPDPGYWCSHGYAIVHSGSCSFISQT